MYLTIKQQVKQLSKEDYRNIKKLCHIAKNLANEAIYNVRQCYFREKRYLNYYENWKLLKDNSVNYRKLQTHIAQQVIQQVDGMFQSFFALLRQKKAGKYSQKVRLPKYLPKDGFIALTITDFNLRKGTLSVPYSREFGKTHKKITLRVSPALKDKKVKVIRIVPKAEARYFEIQYAYEAVVEQRELDKTKALGIDLGVNNLATCATSMGKAFIIDGRRLKAINQWYNKENARLQSIKDKQKRKKTTKRQKVIARKRSNRVNDYMSKTARKIINFCLENNIGVIVCGCNSDFQRDSYMGKVNNQNFVNIPFGKLRAKLQYLCELYGMDYHEQEESYTSKASFWDMDEIPIYSPENQGKYKFSGSRIHRGTYKTSKGYKFNADVNGALNILRKSNVVPLTWLYGRGELDTPARIRVA
ncbi:MAG: transposase [Synergistaceae bacterium]|nr:transposase [Synergistaceae bacterium]MBQ6664509.1 transposase [Synergistaceae bacterium]MBQ6980927.1 transposase [Synergistaceae bacterium]